MSGRENHHRNSGHSDGIKDSSLGSYLKMSYDQLYATLKAQNKSSDEIDRTIDSVKERKKKIHKVVKKFRMKIEQKYGQLDEPDLIKKGMAHAEKYGLNDIEKREFIKQVLRPGYDQYTLDGSIKYSKMSRFLGLDTYAGQIINVGSKDYAKLNELVVLYNSTKQIFNDIKNQTYSYRDCAPEALLGEYDTKIHNVTSFIHPIVAMLFVPKIAPLEDRCLKTNIARLIMQRIPNIANQQNLNENIVQGELEKEFEFAVALSNDPNSLGHFSNDTPLENIIKRFKCQIELWKNVLNIRQGRYYSSSYQTDDGISAFTQCLSNYDQTHFDTLENLNIQDEGVMLKKILSIFAIRPTFTQVTSMVQRISMGITNVNSLSQTSFINLPVINIRLPSSNINSVSNVHLDQALNQTDYFIEHKSLVPKNRSVIWSQDFVFFCADRKHRVVNVSSFTQNRNIALPQTYIGASTINPTKLDFNHALSLSTEQFKISGIISLDTPPSLDIVSGCSALITTSPSGGNPAMFIKYAPGYAAIKQSNAAGLYESNKPFTIISEDGTDGESFNEKGRNSGCVFFYVNVRSR